MITNNIIVLLLTIFICIIIGQPCSFETDEQESMNDFIIEPRLIKSNPSFIGQYPLMDKPIDPEISSDLTNRRSESAEKYFNWAEKTHRPIEFLRGKRFWLFAKKDESDMSADIMPPVNSQQNSLTQGLWRSGIVGRRRRR